MGACVCRSVGRGGGGGRSVSSACVPFLRPQVCRLHSAPPGQTPPEQIHRGLCPNPESGFLQLGPLPTKLRGRGITITTAQLGRVDWPGRVRLKGFTSSSKQMQVGHCGRPYSRSRSERSVFKTTAEAESSQETKGVRPGRHSKPPP